MAMTGLSAGRTSSIRSSRSKVECPPSYRSFLVRLWREPSKAGGKWRGEVESIQSGEIMLVDSLDQALVLLRRAAEQPADSAAQTETQSEDQ